MRMHLDNPSWKTIAKRFPATCLGLILSAMMMCQNALAQESDFNGFDILAERNDSLIETYYRWETAMIEEDVDVMKALTSPLLLTAAAEILGVSEAEFAEYSVKARASAFKLIETTAISVVNEGSKVLLQSPEHDFALVIATLSQENFADQKMDVQLFLLWIYDDGNWYVEPLSGMSSQQAVKSAYPEMVNIPLGYRPISKMK